MQTKNAELREITARLQTEQRENTDSALRSYSAEHPNDADALSLLAQIEERDSRKKNAAALWRRCLELVPEMISARFRYAKLLFKLGEIDAALTQIDSLLHLKPEDAAALQLQANIFGHIGEFQRARDISEFLTSKNPRKPNIWLNHGHALRACGLREQSIASYRKALACDPRYGRAWWALSDLKTFRFGDDDIVEMEKLLSDPQMSQDNRPQVLFAFGKAHEDRHNYVRSWDCYSKANAALRLRIDYDPDRLTERIAKIKTLTTPSFFEKRASAGCRAADPIFILGQPRSGSTLIEQMLSSHSAVEGTGELPYIGLLGKELEEEYGTQLRDGYLDILKILEPTALRALGQKYLERAKLHRKTGKPFFVDKNPSNYLYTGFIHLILPNAKIIDARRNPAACSLSMFKQNFSKTNLRLGELGDSYRNYISLMAHFDAVLQGKVCRVIYENLVHDFEGEVRRLLAYCDLPFENECLNFHKSDRAVKTPSSEQVRQPISTAAIDHWRNYEFGLGPLLRSLGSALTEYPNVPADLR